MSSHIAVIGASTASLYTAELLARGGKRVTLFERSSSLSPQPRTYIITPGIERIIPDLDPNLIRHRIECIELQAESALTQIRLTRPDLIIDRRELILELARRAEEAGVEIRCGWEFSGFGSRDGGTAAEFSHLGERTPIAADWLIGGDGVASKVSANLPGSGVPAVPLLQAEVDLPAGWDERVTKVWFRREETPYFYWLIPDRGRRGVVGLISAPGVDIRQLLDRFLGEQGFSALAYQSGQASLHARGLKSNYQIGSLPVSLVGDAAGQVKVTTVGGTVTGLAGARGAAESILDGGGLPRMIRETRRELNLHLFIRTLLDRMTSADYSQLIESITPAVEAFLANRDRDGMRSQFWKLPLLQPRFIPLGLKLLVRR